MQAARVVDLEMAVCPHIRSHRLAVRKGHGDCCARLTRAGDGIVAVDWIHTGRWRCNGIDRRFGLATHVACRVGSRDSDLVTVMQTAGVVDMECSVRPHVRSRRLSIRKCHGDGCARLTRAGDGIVAVDRIHTGRWRCSGIDRRFGLAADIARGVGRGDGDRVAIFQSTGVVDLEVAVRIHGDFICCSIRKGHRDACAGFALACDGIVAVDWIHDGRWWCHRVHHHFRLTADIARRIGGGDCDLVAVFQCARVVDLEAAVGAHSGFVSRSVRERQSDLCTGLACAGNGIVTIDWVHAGRRGSQRIHLDDRGITLSAVRMADHHRDLVAMRKAWIGHSELAVRTHHGRRGLAIGEGHGHRGSGFCMAGDRTLSVDRIDQRRRRCHRLFRMRIRGSSGGCRRHHARHTSAPCQQRRREA